MQFMFIIKIESMELPIRCDWHYRQITLVNELDLTNMGDSLCNAIKLVDISYITTHYCTKSK